MAEWYHAPFLTQRSPVQSPHITFLIISRYICKIKIIMRHTHLRTCETHTSGNHPRKGARGKGVFTP